MDVGRKPALQQGGDVVALVLEAEVGIGRAWGEEFIADLPRIVSAMDQPSIDGINTWYAAKAAGSPPV